MTGRTKKTLILLLKIAVFLGIVGSMGYAIYQSWKKLQAQNVQLNAIDWRFAPLAVLGFGGVMLTSAFTWRWLAVKMKDHSPLVPMLGAYTYSQLGKYIIGKVALLLMRIERSGRFGMKASVCTISTLLENALYMISGALVGIIAIARIAGELVPGQRALVWPATIVIVIILAIACHPGVFYTLINKAMRKFKKPEIPASRQLTMGTLLLGAAMFIPCWIFGGFALWASGSCMQALPLVDCWWFAGAFAMSVIIGMASFIPGGFGIREAVLTATLTLQFQSLGLGHARALLLAGAAAILQRVFQLIAEVILGVTGSLLTRAPKENPPPEAPSA